MRSGIRVVSVVLLLFPGLLGFGSASGQSVTPCASIGVFSASHEFFIPMRKGQPAVAYTATIKETFERTLAGGSTLHWTTESTQARDESGRTFVQRIEGCNLDSNGQPQLRTWVEINDRANKTTTSWRTGPGNMMLATIFHTQRFVGPDWKDIPRTPYVRSPGLESTTKEDLGTRTIAGLEATGSRTTRILPVGSAGNDTPLKMVQETWTAQQNHAVLMEIDDDPLSGRRTWEVESLTLGPPDPALFTPPANYKVWDRNPEPQAQTTADAKP
jgi:hypothetical protein